MLNLNLNDVLVEFKDGSIQNVGPTNKHAEAKLFDVTTAEVREFGDRRVKIVCEDESGNEIQIALFPEQVEGLLDDIEAVKTESRVFE